MLNQWSHTLKKWKSSHHPHHYRVVGRVHFLLKHYRFGNALGISKHMFLLIIMAAFYYILLCYIIKYIHKGQSTIAHHHCRQNKILLDLSSCKYFCFRHLQSFETSLLRLIRFSLTVTSNVTFDVMYSTHDGETKMQAAKYHLRKLWSF